MTTSKLIILMVLLLVPGGSLVLLAMATAKAFSRVTNSVAGVVNKTMNTVTKHKIVPQKITCWKRT